MGMPQMGANTPALRPDNRNMMMPGGGPTLEEGQPQVYTGGTGFQGPIRSTNPINGRRIFDSWEDLRNAGNAPQAPTVPATDGGAGTNLGGQPAQPSIFGQSAQAYTDALSTTRDALGMMPSTVSAQAGQASTYKPTTGQAASTQATTYKPATGTASQMKAVETGSQGYDASQMAGVSDITAQNVKAQDVTGQGFDASTISGVSPISANQVGTQTIAQNMGLYKNPYEQQVVDNAMKDIERQRQMQMNQVGAQATAANAFGGSRQGVVEAETNRAALEQSADTAAQLRSQGFAQQAALAGQDVATAQQAALANQQANLQAGTTSAANTLAAQRANQEAMQQASQFGASAANQAALANQQAQLNAQQANQQAGLQAQSTSAANQLATQQANQQALNQAGQFGAGAANTASLANQQAMMQANQQNMAARNQMGLANMGALNQAGQFGATAANQASLANQAAANQMTQANMGAMNQAGQFGASAQNQMTNANLARDMQAQLANQNAGMNYRNQTMAGANQLGNLSNLGFNMGNTLNQNQMAAGNQQQALMQALIDAGRGQTQNYYNSPQNALNTLIGAYSGSQTGQQQQQNTMTPGLFDFLSLGLQF